MKNITKNCDTIVRTDAIQNQIHISVTRTVQYSVKPFWINFFLFIQKDLPEWTLRCVHQNLCRLLGFWPGWRAPDPRGQPVSKQNLCIRDGVGGGGCEAPQSYSTGLRLWYRYLFWEKISLWLLALSIKILCICFLIRFLPNLYPDPRDTYITNFEKKNK